MFFGFTLVALGNASWEVLQCVVSTWPQGQTLNRHGQKGVGIPVVPSRSSRIPTSSQSYGCQSYGTYRGPTCLSDPCEDHVGTLFWPEAGKSVSSTKMHSSSFGEAASERPSSTRCCASSKELTCRCLVHLSIHRNSHTLSRRIHTHPHPPADMMPTEEDGKLYKTTLQVP